ncbi:unnamed protein product [Phaedon cochleariae]|uniref:Glucose-methanol-choline oxidoreductase N-terminal domain-containing protein n=1 Tax=Phaedon cochleariae TaxID=80249 RepID=A0A9P0GP57_PHACE|nr:unnamed protein product [Phaedon cochleariae]
MSEQIAASCPNNLEGTAAQLFLLLVNHLVQAKCSLGSPEQYPPDHGPNLKDLDEFDFIVVGGGSAGSVVANQLSSNGKWTVLVLEAGGYPSATSDVPILYGELANTHEDWQYETEPSEGVFLGEENGRNKWPRGKALGGSSSINYMLYTRGNKNDYDRWAHQGNTGWDWSNVERSFEEMENLMDDSGQKKLLSLHSYESGEPVVNIVKEAAWELGYPTVEGENSNDPLGYFNAPLTVENGTRLNAAKAFLGKVKNRKNLFVAVHAFVPKVVIDHDSKTATGVEVKLGKQTLIIKARKEVIVSGGAVNSPQLLMLSGIGPKDHLQHFGIRVVENLPVGDNLQDHPAFKGFHMKYSPDLANSYTEQDILHDAFEYFVHKQGKFAEVSMMNQIGFINTKNSSAYPNLEILSFLSNPENNYAPFKTLRKIVCASFFDSLVEYGSGSPVLSTFVILLKPKSRGRILLKSRNPFDKPLIHAGYFTDENDEDMEFMLEGVRYLEKVTRTQAFTKYNPEIFRSNFCQNFDYGSDDYWKCSIRHLVATLFHPAGTCKMGPVSDETSVVDPRLRVKGVNNLRVADASIMPEIVSNHPNAASMMIGYKAGQMIIDDWSKQKEHNEL